MKFIGLDISLNHGAIVELVDEGDEPTRHWYYSANVGVADKSKALGSRVPKECVDPKVKDNSTKFVRRLDWVESWVARTIAEAAPDYAALEDYAIRAEQGAHYLGEVGGAARLALWRAGINFRLHDPIALKMYATHDGTAGKGQVRLSVRQRWGVSFDQYEVGKDAATAEDLADAYSLAQMARAEFRLRFGLDRLSDHHEQEIRIFNRVTKANPVNLLDRDWIRNPDGRSCSDLCSSARCTLAVLESKGKLPEATKAKLRKASK